MKRYKIWKASINAYRVLDTQTGETFVLSNLTLMGVVFKVDVKGYFKAANKKFADSGDPNDYFAWMEADSFSLNNQAVLYPSRVFYNPFKSFWFKDRATSQEISSASLVTTVGNILSYRF